MPTPVECVEPLLLDEHPAEAAESCQSNYACVMRSGGRGVTAIVSSGSVTLLVGCLSWSCGSATSKPCRLGDVTACSRWCYVVEDAPSCTRLGALYETQVAAGSAPDQPAREYLRACLLGDGRGCTLAGLKYLLGKGVPQSTPLAARAFDAACTLKNGDGCAMLGALRAEQEPPKPGEADELYLKGCKLGGALGCRLAGSSRLHAGGDNAKYGKWYLDRACTLHDEYACVLARAVAPSPAGSDQPAPAASSTPPPAPSASASSPAPSASAPPAAPSASAPPAASSAAPATPP